MSHQIPTVMPSKSSPSFGQADAYGLARPDLSSGVDAGSIPARLSIHLQPRPHTKMGVPGPQACAGQVETTGNFNAVAK